MATHYTKDHEWIRLDGDVATVGITEHAQSQLGDIVYVELPEIGRKVDKGGEAAVVESVKAASDVYAPISGEVVEGKFIVDRIGYESVDLKFVGFPDEPAKRLPIGG